MMGLLLTVDDSKKVYFDVFLRAMGAGGCAKMKRLWKSQGNTYKLPCQKKMDPSVDHTHDYSRL